ncbi:MAG: hypothetical protein DMD75_15525 [Candidatus Rokuibacteriota bacterium]|nr:MAG: hypothetical protein DMD75_15525 [Candidatus Rokubacteria bacterium]
MRVLTQEPDHAEGERRGQARDRHDVDRSEARPARRPPHEQEDGGQHGGGDGEAEQLEIPHQTFIRARRPGREPARHDDPAGHEQGRRDADPRDEAGGARAAAHADPDGDEHDTDREERGLARERGGAARDVGHRARAHQSQDRAGDDVHSRDYRLQWIDMRHSGAMTRAVTVALLLAGCAESPPPVTAEKVLDVPGIQPVVNAVALSADGSVVAVGDMDGELVMRELPSGAERWRGRVAARRVDGLVFSADGSLLASTAQEGRTVELWQVLAGRQAAVLEIRDSRAAAFHPTEPTLVLGGLGALYVVDAQRGEIVRTLPNAHGGENVYAAAFSSDGQVLATASDQGSIKVWTWPALTLRTSVSMSKSLEQMAPVSLVLQGTRAAANGLLGRVHIVDLAKEREERTFDNTPEAPGHGMHAEMRRSLAFSQDGDWLFAPDMHDRGVRILNLSSGKTYPVFRGDAPFYKAMSISVPASLVALLRPGDGQGRGPYGLEVWRLAYRTR